MKNIDLNRIYKRKKSDRDIFEELMSFKVKEILLIANYYDAYTIEREGQFSDKIFGEYLQLNLYTSPRFTSVANEEAALQQLARKHFDLIIIMAGLDKETPVTTSRNIKRLYPDVYQLMLVNNNADLAHFRRMEAEAKESIERVFVWNGSTKVFLAMAKYLEDKINLEADTRARRRAGNPRRRGLREILLPLPSPALHRDHDADAGDHRRGTRPTTRWDLSSRCACARSWHWQALSRTPWRS